MKVDSFGKYRNFLLPLTDCIAIILGYYLMSVLITDSFLMNPTSAVTKNEILISILLSVIVFQIVFRIFKRYNTVIRYETTQDYLVYILLSIISTIIVSIIEDENGVYFSELSPRPHDTGMVTLAGTQNLSEFELHARAVLGLPIPEITFERIGASAVILADEASENAPRYEGVEEAMAMDPRNDVRIFGKPSARKNRRMGVVVGYAPHGSSLDELRDRVKAAAEKVKVIVQ